MTAPDIAAQPPVSVAQSQLSLSNNLQSVKDNWKTILNKLGKATAGLLSSAQPTDFQNNILVLTFDASAQMNKKLCESNGRLEQIQSILSSVFDAPITVKLESAAAGSAPSQSVVSSPKLNTVQKGEAINHPAVKTVLLGLDATIIDVGENSQ